MLTVKFPKAYPSKAIPILSITQSKGLTSAQVNKILSAIHAEAQRCLGSEAIFAVGGSYSACNLILTPLLPGDRSRSRLDEKGILQASRTQKGAEQPFACPRNAKQGSRGGEGKCLFDTKVTILTKSR